MKAAALRGALSDRARDGRVHILSSLVEGTTPSTKSALAALANLNLGKNVLVVVAEKDLVSAVSIRNISNIHWNEVGQLNTYDVVNADDIVFTKEAMEQFLSGPIKGKSVKAVASESEIA